MTIRHTGCRFAVSCTSHGSSWSFVVTSRSIRVDSCRFDNIFNPYRRHLRLLQIDFRYAFPCHKRWFLRLPVSHHHWAANRPPVWRFVNCLWRFAAVWVYWTTLTAWRRFLTFKPFCVIEQLHVRAMLFQSKTNLSNLLLLIFFSSSSPVVAL